MDEYTSNSHKSRETPTSDKKIEKVVAGEVIRRKKPLNKRFMEVFVGGDDAKSVLEFVVLDILIPAAKDTMADAVTQGFERMIFGESRVGRARSSSPSRYQAPGRIAYNRYSSSQPIRDPRPEPTRQSRFSHDFDDILLATRVEAEEVISRLFDIISQYETATVGDLYELLGIKSEYTDIPYGWTDLRGAGVTKTRNGYLLDLPKPEPLN